MARLAASHSSKDDDDFGAHRLTSGTQAAPKRIVKDLSLIEALDLVLQGEMAAIDLFIQMPSQLTTVIERAAQSSCGQDFRSMRADEQKIIMAMLRNAIRSGDAEPALKSPTNTRSREPSSREGTAAMSGLVGSGKSKSWWKFW
jgi:hypothetical protein